MGILPSPFLSQASSVPSLTISPHLRPPQPHLQSSQPGVLVIFAPLPCFQCRSEAFRSDFRKIEDESLCLQFCDSIVNKIFDFVVGHQTVPQSHTSHPSPVLNTSHLTIPHYTYKMDTDASVLLPGDSIPSSALKTGPISITLLKREEISICL